jgi:hypothetical protein
MIPPAVPGHAVLDENRATSQRIGRIPPPPSWKDPLTLAGAAKNDAG